MTENTYFETISGKNESIGNVTIKQDPLSIGREEKVLSVFVREEQRSDIQVGDYVRIPYEDEGDPQRMMLGVVDKLEYRQKTEFDDQYTQESPSRQLGDHMLGYIARVEPIAIISDSPHHDVDTHEIVRYKRETVSFPPRPEASVYKVQDKHFLRVGLRIPAEGEIVGRMSVGGDIIPNEKDPMMYRLFNPGVEDEGGQPQMFRHTMVSGSTGQGKTHFSKNLLRQFAGIDKRFEVDIPPSEKEELRKKEGKDTAERPLNIAVIDPENEYVQMKDDNPDLPDEAKQQYKEWGLEVGGLGDNLQVWTPMVAGSPTSISGANRFNIPFSIVEGRPELLIGANVGEPTYLTIENMVRQFFQLGQDPTYSNFREWANEEFIPNIENESIQGAVRLRVISDVYSQIFDGQGGKPLDEVTGQMFREPETTVTVFPMKHLKGQKEKLVVLSILTYIVENKISADPDDYYVKGSPMILAVDEAHKYLQDPETSRERFIINKFKQAARRGRKEHFGLYMVTQNPQDIFEEISDQTNTKIYLGLDSNVVEDNRVFVPFEFKERVKEFDKGEAVVNAPGVRPVEVRGFPYCLTRHDE